MCSIDSVAISRYRDKELLSCRVPILGIERLPPPATTIFQEYKEAVTRVMNRI
jgi:hypothetical protein